MLYRVKGLLRWLNGKESVCNAGKAGDTGLIPGSGGSPGGGQQPTPVILPGESHGQRSLEGYSPECYKELDRTEVAEHACTHIQSEVS